MELAEWKGRWLPKLRGAEVYDWNESGMQYQGSAWGTNAAPGTEWSENGNHILQANGQITTCFLFSAQLLGGGEILRLSGSGAGQSVDLVRLLYIIRLYLSLLFRRQAGIEYNYMLCIIASGYFFSGASAARWWLECKRLFLPFCKKCDRKKTT